MILTLALNNGIVASTNNDDCCPPELLERITDLWRLQGLEPGNPITMTETRTVTANGDLDLTVSGDCETTATVDRQ